MELREATIRDTDSVVELIKSMVQDMASYGGHALNEGSEISLQLHTHFKEVSKKENHIFLLAVPEGTEDKSVGVIEASVVCPPEIFQPKSVLHIHSIYVEPSRRGE